MTTTTTNPGTIDHEEVLRLRKEGVSLRDVAKRMGCSKANIERIEKDAKAKAGGPPAAAAGNVVYFDPQDIEDNPYWKRPLNDNHVRSLADDIKARTLLQKPLGRLGPDGKAQLAFGHHRKAAIILLIGEGAWEGGVPIEIQELTDLQMVLMAIAENKKRQGPNPLEEILADRAAIDGVEGVTIQAIAESRGIDRSTLSNNLRLLRLPKAVLDKVAAGEVPTRAARELLCLVAEDHAHEDIMESVIREIGYVWLGSAPDWRANNVRRLINEYIHGARVAFWRRLEPGSLHHTAPPAFDVARFVAEHGSRVHHIPSRDEKREGSERWTCATAQWKKWQDRAAGAGPGGGKAKEKPPAKGLAHLVNDPLGKQVLSDAVSPETAAKAIGEEMAASRFPTGLDLTDRVLAWRRVNQHLARLLGSHPDQASRDNLRTSARVLLWSPALDLADSGITEESLAAAINRTVDDFEAVLAKRVKAPASLDAQAAEKLGTRAKVVNIGYNSNAHALDNRSSFHTNEPPPPYFPDLDECRKTCTWGATYTKGPRDSVPQLRCLNEEHWQEKLKAGMEAYKRKMQDQVDAADNEDNALAEALLAKMPVELGFPVAAALLRAARPGYGRAGDLRRGGLPAPGLDGPEQRTPGVSGDPGHNDGSGQLK